MMVDRNRIQQFHPSVPTGSWRSRNYQPTRPQSSSQMPPSSRNQSSTFNRPSPETTFSTNRDSSRTRLFSVRSALQVDREASTFLKDEVVEGITFVTDLELVKKMQSELWRFTNGLEDSSPYDFFPASTTNSLNKANLECLKSEPYVVAPSPDGTRYLLYVDSTGEVYLENQTINFFLMHKNRAIQLLSHDRSVLKDTVLDGYFVRPKILDSGIAADKNGDKRGRLTFVIQDAIRCNGTDLTGRGIVDRIAFIEKHVMTPRLDLIQNGFIRPENEAFELDIVEYKNVLESRDLINGDVDQEYLYPFRSLIFHPCSKEYSSSFTTNSLISYLWTFRPLLFNFRLRINSDNDSTGDLLVISPKSEHQPIANIEKVYSTITLTDQLLKQMNNKIIECHWVDNQWIFHDIRPDRLRPNAEKTVEDKMITLNSPVTRNHFLTLLF